MDADQSIDLLEKGLLRARGHFVLQGGQLYDSSASNWRLLYSWMPERRRAFVSPVGDEAAINTLTLLNSAEPPTTHGPSKPGVALTLIGDGGARFKHESAMVRFSSANGLLSLLTYENGRQFELSRDGKLWHPLRHPERHFDRIYLQALTAAAESGIIWTPQARGRLSELAERQPASASS